jgi:hypothetical protein
LRSWDADHCDRRTPTFEVAVRGTLTAFVALGSREAPPMTDELDQVRTELQHATEHAKRDARKPLQNFTQSIERSTTGTTIRSGTESMREELSRLETEASDEAREYIVQAREHLQAYEENREFLEE